ncbi:hypothetical protein [Bacillus licheniformis]|uniref:hypothetical protein n=1 Tax=Bacillus licheniformis TaxID=1402 RepID=UPI0002D417AF|nr:hypothetical protein [Bacillus licheniformis]
MDIVTQLQHWTTFFVEKIIPVAAFIITYRQYVLQKNETSTQKEYSKITNYTQNGLLNEMNINVSNNKEAEEYYYKKNQMINAQEKKLKFDRFSSAIDKTFVIIIYITGALIVCKNFSSFWNSNKGLINKFPEFNNLMMDAIQSAGQLTLNLVFSLSIVMLLKTLLFTTKKLSIQNIFTWFKLLLINIGAFLALSVLKTKNLGEEFSKLINKTPEAEENITIYSLLEITPPFLMILLIISLFIVATYLLKMIIIKEKFFSNIEKNTIVIATLLLLAIPLAFQFSI